MAYLPNPTAHAWDSLVVGSASPDPVILKLTEQNLVTNGDFEEILSNWDGNGVRTDLGSDAMKGNYGLVLSAAEYAHQAILASAPDKLLLTGYVKMTANTGWVDIYLYGSASAARINPVIADFVKVRLVATDAVNINQWMPFYIESDVNTWGDYKHIEFITSVTGAQIDDLRLYEVDEVVEMDCPQTMSLKWKRFTDAKYELLNGDIKDYLKGWRGIFSIGYQYCSREQLIKDIGISENMFNFFIPHGTNLMGAYVRIANDFDNSYFKNRLIGHQQSLQLESTFLTKFKNREYGSTYFTVTVP